MSYGTTRVGFLPEDNKNPSGEGQYQQGLQLYREEAGWPNIKCANSIGIYIMCT
jgi:hypothetical protein